MDHPQELLTKTWDTGGRGGGNKIQILKIRLFSGKLGFIYTCAVRPLLKTLYKCAFIIF